MIDEARARGARIVIVEPEAADAINAPAAAASTIADRATQAADRLSRLLMALPSLAAESKGTLQRQLFAPDAWWIARALLLAVLALLVGGGIRRWFTRWAGPQLLEPPPGGESTRAARAGYLLTFVLVHGLALAIQLAVAFVLVVVATQSEAAARNLAVLAVVLYGAVSAFALVLRSILMPTVSAARPVALDDNEAAGLHRALSLTAAGAFSLLVAIMWLTSFQVPEDAEVAFFGFGALLAAIALGFVLLRHRHSIAKIIRAGKPAQEIGGWRRASAAAWPIAAVVYLGLAWLITVVRLLLELPHAIGLIAAPLYALISGLAAYALALIMVGRVLPRHRRSPASTVATGQAPVATQSGAQEYRAQGGHAYARLAEHAAGIAAWLFGLWVLTAMWGLGDTGVPVDGLWGAVVAIFLGYFAWRCIGVAFDQRIEREGGYSQPEPGDEGGGTEPATRVGTLLPLFRVALLIVVGVLCTMIVLSEMGINVAPLFAGAGIVGLAIGFGAQALVRDIFSGVFFLIDDAFRVGEYIEIGSVRGTVEKISIRSMQLRHHLGPLHTIPFGEIQSLTNYSRDWVIMKLPLRLTYDTNVEHVRKLIKNLGQELLKDPEIGDMFLEPLKSQGVMSMEDSAMIIRVKFMTRPGKQFQIRKKVYAEIRNLFEREGIRFAHREVTVRLAEPDDDTRPHGERMRSIGAAALSAVVDDEKKGTRPG